MRVTLKVLEGPYRGREFTFDHHDTFLIGRSDNAHLYLPDDRFFSRHHCLLEIAPPRCFRATSARPTAPSSTDRRFQKFSWATAIGFKAAKPSWKYRSLPIPSKHRSRIR